MVTQEKIIEILLSSGVEIDKENIDFSKSFEQIGLDSLDVFNFFTEIDAELGVDVPDTVFETLTTLDDVKEYLSRNIS